MWYVQFPIIILLNEFHIPNLTYFLSNIMQEFSARCFTIKNALPWFLSSLVSMMLRVPLPSKCWFNLKMRKSSCHQCKTCPWALVHSSGGTGSETPSSDKNDHDPTRRPLNHYPPKKIARSLAKSQCQWESFYGKVTWTFLGALGFILWKMRRSFIIKIDNL